MTMRRCKSEYFTGPILYWESVSQFEGHYGSPTSPTYSPFTDADYIRDYNAVMFLGKCKIMNL